MDCDVSLYRRMKMKDKKFVLLFVGYLVDVCFFSMYF